MAASRSADGEGRRYSSPKRRCNPCGNTLSLRPDEYLVQQVEVVQVGIAVVVGVEEFRAGS